MILQRMAAQLGRFAEAAGLGLSMLRADLKIGVVPMMSGRSGKKATTEG